MFFNKLLGKEKNIKDEIKDNLVNIFDQRCKLSLQDYEKNMLSKRDSIYKHYGLVDLFYLTETSKNSYANHIEIAILNFETRIKEVNVNLQIDNLIVTLNIEYLSHFGDRESIELNLTRN